MRFLLSVLRRVVHSGSVARSMALARQGTAWLASRGVAGHAWGSVSMHRWLAHPPHLAVVPGHCYEFVQPRLVAIQLATDAVHDQFLRRPSEKGGYGWKWTGGMGEVAGRVGQKWVDRRVGGWVGVMRPGSLWPPLQAPVRHRPGEPPPSGRGLAGCEQTLASIGCTAAGHAGNGSHHKFQPIGFKFEESPDGLCL